MIIKETCFADLEEGDVMKFYTIKLPKFIGGFVRVVMNMFKKEK